MMPPKDKAQNNCWYWLWLLFVVYIAMCISSGEIVTYIILLVIGSILTLIGQWFYRKLSGWFSSQEQLCDVLFANTDKAGNEVVERNIQILASEDCQIIHMYLQSMNPKEITELKVSFGKRKNSVRKFIDILVNRHRMKRLWARPSPNWWADFRMPTVVKDELSPQIKQVISHYTLKKSSSVTGTQDGNGYIAFYPPIIIPAGKPFGIEPQIQIDLEIITPDKWRGAIQCESSIGGVRQFTTRKVRVNK